MKPSMLAIDLSGMVYIHVVSSGCEDVRAFV